MGSRKMIRPALMAATLTVLLVAVGCGKQGMPSPKKTMDTFTITGATNTVMNECLVVSGTVQGAAANLETMYIEVAPIDSFDDCPGCPFTAREAAAFTPGSIDLNDQGEFLLTYCPQNTAPMYRWRLVGHSVFSGLPYAMTTPQVAVVAPE